MQEESDVKPMTSICQDLDHYSRCLDQLDKSMPGFEDFKQWLKSTLSEKVLEKLDVSLPKGEKLRILGVGSGDGQIEYSLISRILTKYPLIQNTVVEPSKKQLQRYHNLIETKQAELAGVEYDWRVQTLSEYKLSSEESEDETKFHFISVMFSLYYEPNWKFLLPYLYGRLAPGGVMLTALETEECHFTKIDQRFNFALGVDLPIMTNTDIRAYFEEQNIPVVLYHQPEVQHDVDVTSCFDDESHEGALLLDLLSNVGNFRDNASPATLAEFRAYLKTLATEKDGKIFLYYDSDFALAWKI